MKIIVDANGGDNGIDELVLGCTDAMVEPDVNLIFVGRKEEIEAAVKRSGCDSSRVEIVDAPDIITNDEEPVFAIRRKKEASIVVASRLLSEGKGDALLSSGSTGALLASGIFIVKRLPGIERAALCVFVPTGAGFSMIADAGANVDCQPEYLVQFAKMGSVYYETAMGKANPRVALLNIGSEPGKGNKLVKDAYPLLEETELNFIGNIEGRDVPFGKAEVIVSDGYGGNILLKTIEGTASVIFSKLKGSFMESVSTKIAALLMKKSLKNLKESFDYREYGAAPLLGLTKPVFKAHGSSDRLAYKSAIKTVANAVRSDVVTKITDQL